jgi:cysteine synthase
MQVAAPVIDAGRLFLANASWLNQFGRATFETAYRCWTGKQMLHALHGMPRLPRFGDGSSGELAGQARVFI